MEHKGTKTSYRTPAAAPLHPGGRAGDVRQLGLRCAGDAV